MKGWLKEVSTSHSGDPSAVGKMKGYGYPDKTLCWHCAFWPKTFVQQAFDWQNVCFAPLCWNYDFWSKTVWPTVIWSTLLWPGHLPDHGLVDIMIGRHTFWSAVLFGGYLFVFTQQKSGKMSIGRMFLTKRHETNELLLLLLNFTNCWIFVQSIVKVSFFL